MLRLKGEEVWLLEEEVIFRSQYVLTQNSRYRIAQIKVGHMKVESYYVGQISHPSEACLDDLKPTETFTAEINY